jgi:O-antigen/teichoic acid export membrane protein
MRTKNSIKNMIAAMSSNIVTILIGLIAQAVFIKILGVDYLGLNGLFTNIISMLGIVELGVGNAIIYNLYKPIADNNVEEIKSLMKFYRKSYHIIAFVVLTIGLIIIPFLPLIIDEVTVDVNIVLIYLLFLIEIVCSYLLSYKRSIFYADQKNNIVNYIHIGYTIVMNVSQLLVLYLTKNYYLYLIVKIIARILENIVITYMANKKYSYLLDKNVKPLDEKIEKDIFTKVKALFFHKIGSFVVLGTDNIIISKYLGLAVVGLYSNYYLIINAVQTLFGQALVALTPSVGNMLVKENTTKCYDIFKKVRFMNFWIATFTSIAILIIIEPFISIWIGEEYLLSNVVLIILVFNFFQKMMRNTYQTFKEAAGIYYEDRFVPLFESIINIVVSIILVKLIGLPGVFIGTIVSGFALWFYSYPKYVYKKLFNRKYINYLKETLAYIFLFIIIAFITYLISMHVNISNMYLQVIVNAIISVIVPNVILLIIFYNTDNFKYYLKLIKSKLSKNI